MKQKKTFSLILALVLALSLLAGCGNTAAPDTNTSADPGASESTVVKDENEAAAEQLLVDLTGSDLDALGQYDAGNYAYWLASGISTDYDQAMVENCIELFCTENLSE